LFKNKCEKQDSNVRQKKMTPGSVQKEFAAIYA
jgi:hypothetical protein